MAFVQDLLAGPLPAEYDACDVMYADLPWRAGFIEFERRTGAQGRSYADLMAAVFRIVRAATCPVVLTCGKLAWSHLPLPRETIHTRLNGATCLALVYNADFKPECADTIALLHWLAERYGCVGDFCCGYGRAGRIFSEHGKRYIMSDYNSECIGYIGETFEKANG